MFVLRSLCGVCEFIGTKGCICGKRRSTDANGRVCSLHATWTLQISTQPPAHCRSAVSRRGVFAQPEQTDLGHGNERRVIGLCSGARRIRSGCKYDSCQLACWAIMAGVERNISRRAGVYLATTIGGDSTWLHASQSTCRLGTLLVVRM
jgi:hypothetical protein